MRQLRLHVYLQAALGSGLHVFLQAALGGGRRVDRLLFAQLKATFHTMQSLERKHNPSIDPYELKNGNDGRHRLNNARQHVYICIYLCIYTQLCTLQTV